MIPGVLHHHERVDGGGYPHGLKGEAIPFRARVLCVADALDAMTSDRPYRQALPAKLAEGEVFRAAGTQFDVTMVEAVLKVGGVTLMKDPTRGGLANTLNPGKGLNEDVTRELYKSYEAKAQDGIMRMEEKPSLIDILVNIVPRNPVAAFVEGNMLQIIFMALLFGVE